MPFAFPTEDLSVFGRNGPVLCLLHCCACFCLLLFVSIGGVSQKAVMRVGPAARGSAVDPSWYTVDVQVLDEPHVTLFGSVGLNALADTFVQMTVDDETHAFVMERREETATLRGQLLKRGQFALSNYLTRHRKWHQMDSDQLVGNTRPTFVASSAQLMHLFGCSA